MEERVKQRKQVKEREKKRSKEKGQSGRNFCLCCRPCPARQRRGWYKKSPTSPLQSVKVFKSCTAGLSIGSGQIEPVKHSSLNLLVPPPLPFSEGGFIQKISRKVRDRHLGFGFCLLGGRGELGEPTVCLHCSFLTPQCPTACSCSRSGGGKKVEE